MEVGPVGRRGLVVEAVGGGGGGSAGDSRGHGPRPGGPTLHAAWRVTVAHEALLRAVYAAYNRRDADSLLALVGDEVDWPDGPLRLHGKTALRAYWRHQWARIHTYDEVVELRSAPGDASVVRIRQVVRDLDGAVVSRGAFDHVYAWKTAWWSAWTYDGSPRVRAPRQIARRASHDESYPWQTVSIRPRATASAA